MYRSSISRLPLPFTLHVNRMLYGSYYRLTWCGWIVRLHAISRKIAHNAGYLCTNGGGKLETIHYEGTTKTQLTQHFTRIKYPYWSLLIRAFKSSITGGRSAVGRVGSLHSVHCGASDGVDRLGIWNTIFRCRQSTKGRSGDTVWWHEMALSVVYLAIDQLLVLFCSARRFVHSVCALVNLQMSSDSHLLLENRQSMKRNRWCIHGRMLNIFYCHLFIALWWVYLLSAVIGPQWRKRRKPDISALII